MKKIISMIMVLTMCLTMCLTMAACSSTPNEPSMSNPPENNLVESEQPSSESESTELTSGDNVSIVGQVAVTIRDDGDTISVQVQREDGRWVIYHCQLKDEFIDRAKDFKMTDVAKISGSFLSMTDMEQENTAIIVTLYDCEIIE